ncbi:unnamed protein product, partial [marine sediment metagenome]
IIGKLKQESEKKQALIKNLRKQINMLKNLSKDIDDISLCKEGCFCMTKTIKGKCGKCGIQKC